MARQASSKPADSTATISFGMVNGGHSRGARQIANGNPQLKRGGVHQFGVPPKGNANFAWVQHFIHHLAPQTALRDSAFLQSEASPQVVSVAKDNMAGFVLANGSMSSTQSGEGDRTI